MRFRSICMTIFFFFQSLESKPTTDGTSSFKQYYDSMLSFYGKKKEMSRSFSLHLFDYSNTYFFTFYIKIFILKRNFSSISFKSKWISWSLPILSWNILYQLFDDPTTNVNKTKKKKTKLSKTIWTIEQLHYFFPTRNRNSIQNNFSNICCDAQWCVALLYRLVRISNLKAEQSVKQTTKKRVGRQRNTNNILTNTWGGRKNCLFPFYNGFQKISETATIEQFDYMSLHI